MLFRLFLCGLLTALLSGIPTLAQEEGKQVNNNEKVKSQKDTDSETAAEEDTEEDAEEEVSAQDLFNQAMGHANKGEFELAIPLVQQARKLDPKADQLVIVLIRLYQSHGMQTAAEDRPAASPFFYAAADVARELLKAKKDELPAPFLEFLAQPIYNAACSLALEGKLRDAKNALVEALELGFSDFEKIDSDEELATLREKKGFDKFIAKHREAATKRLVEEVQGEIAQHESYPFDFSLTSVDGETISKSDFEGKVLIADIWGTWCPPCRKEIPHFIQLRENYGEDGLEILGLNYERSGDETKNIENIKNFMEEYKMNYACVIGDEDTRAQVPNFQGFPTTLFIDKEGKVRLTMVGLNPYSKLEAVAKILLAE